MSLGRGEKNGTERKIVVGGGKIMGQEKEKPVEVKEKKEGKGVKWDYVVLRKTPGKEATRWDYTVEIKGKRDGKAGTVKLKDEKDENTPKDKKMMMEEAWDYSVEINSHE